MPKEQALPFQTFQVGHLMQRVASCRDPAVSKVRASRQTETSGWTDQGMRGIESVHSLREGDGEREGEKRRDRGGAAFSVARA